MFFYALFVVNLYSRGREEEITTALTGCYNTLSVFEIEIEIVYFT